MAYSRWGDSIFYSFYSSEGPPLEKGEQVFAVLVIDREGDVFERKMTYAHMKGREFDRAVRQTVAAIAGATGKSVSADEQAKLQSYMKAFMADVEAKFPSRKTKR